MLIAVSGAIALGIAHRCSRPRPLLGLQVIPCSGRERRPLHRDDNDVINALESIALAGGAIEKSRRDGHALDRPG